MNELFSPDVLRNPYPFYAELRARAPVVRVERPDMWLVSRYEDVATVLRSPELFSSNLMAGADRVLLGADPPAHTRARRIATAALSPSRVATCEPHLREIAARLAARLPADGDVDLMAELAVPLPLLLMARLLAVDESVTPERLKGWSDAFVLAGSGAAPPARLPELRRSLGELHDAFTRLVEERRERPGDDLVSALLAGGDLADDELVSLAKLFLVAGNETTTHLVGNALLVLLRNELLREAVRGDRALVPQLLEETLRFDAPVQFVQRRTSAPTELAGTALPAGAVVAALLGSANRDPARFPDPDRFDLSREPGGHFAFGAGPHACLGAGLARLEAKIALEAILPRLATARLAGELAERVAPPMRGLRRLPVRL